MRSPLFVKALRLAGEVRHLRSELAYEQAAHARTRIERDQARRDVELVALMAKDPRAAAEFVQMAHHIDRGHVPRPQGPPRSAPG